MRDKQASVLERAINATQKGLEKLRAQEKSSREKWTKRYKRFLKAASDLSDLRNVQTQRAERLREIIRGWETETEELTRERDLKREAIRQAEDVLARQKNELALLVARLHHESSRRDEIVDHVFSLNNAVVEALGRRNEFLTGQVYNLLIDDDGRLRSQITLTSSDQCRRVIALVSHITRIDAALAGEAQVEVQKFLDRFERPDHDAQDSGELVKTLFEMLRNILIEKISFKVGPDLYRFISIEIDENVFPELVKAQHLLRHSLRSEKTSSYVRLYRRESMSQPWVEVKLS